MKLGIMQPYFFPYLGHFSLIAAVDEWVVFDVTQYTPKSWMSRNRILHPKEGWQYVNVPLINSSITIKTCEAMVLDVAGSRANILGKLTHYKSTAPFYRKVTELVGGVFDQLPTDASLVDLNVAGLRAVCDYLEIPFRYRVCSKMGLSFPEAMKPGDWAPYICSQMKATSYLNPAGGETLFDPIQFAGLGVELQFAEASEFRYATGPYSYEPHLSILDVLMWNPAEAVCEAAHRDVHIRGASAV